jgi:hypothetical protein
VHTDEPACVIETLPDGRQRVEIDDYDSLEMSCRDYAWLITRADSYQRAWQQYR